MSEDLIQQMTWLNEPASSSRAGEGLRVRARPKTDFWRTTFYGYVTDNGHFLHKSVAGDFTFEARIGGEYAAQYDQAGLMVRLDAENWVKCGAEFVDGAQQGSIVFTRLFSDWSSLPGLARKEPVWWRVVRKRDSLEVLHSSDGERFVSARLGYLPPAANANVGVMCAAPEGQGFDSIFDRLKLEPTAG
jgi:regulation of enolase protein 1 (concanavalin A-like superfamily)